jgi:hypothetical protein
MAVPVLEAQTWSAATTSTFVMTAPAGIQANELLVLLVGNDGNTTITMWSQANAPDGWTYYGEVGDAGSDSFAGIFYKVATGSETDVTVISNGSWMNGGWYCRISGADVGATFLDAYSGEIRTSVIAAPTFTGVTTTVNDCLILANCGYDGADGAIGVTSGATQIDVQTYTSGTEGAGISRCIATQEQATAGLAADVSYSAASAEGWSHQLLAIVGGSSSPSELTVEAGGPYSGTVSTAINLNSTVTPGSDPLPTLLWTIDSGGTGTFSDDSIEDPTFTPDVESAYVLRLTATPSDSAAVFDAASLTSNPVPIPIPVGDRATVSYPEYFPCPTWSYSTDNNPYPQRTQFDNGWTRDRRAFPQTGMSANLTFEMDTVMLEKWATWFESNGWDWFLIGLDNGTGTIDQLVRLITPPTWGYDNYDKVIATVSVEVGPEYSCREDSIG